MTINSSSSTGSSNPANPIGFITASESTSSSEDPIIQYQLDMNVTTIPRLWEEYNQGLISISNAIRGPSIQDLDNRFGIKWRCVDPCRKRYARRRCIWEAIHRASKNLGMSYEVIVEKMERWRCNNHYSLQKVNDLLLKVKSGAPDLWGEKDVELLSII